MDATALPIASRVSKEDAWIGVDLDGTLAESSPVWDGNAIEKPIPLMVERVKRWLAEGKNVRILTARVARGFDVDASNFIAVRKWTIQTFGQWLPVTSEKDPNMIELWDDRAVQVIPNTGESLQESHEREIERMEYSLGETLDSIYGESA